MMMMMIFKAVF